MCSGDVFGLFDCWQFAEVKTQVTSIYFSHLCEQMTAIVTVLTVLCLRLLVTILSPVRPELDPRPGHVRHIVDKVALWQIFLPVLGFRPVSVVALVLHNHLYLNTVLIRWLSRESLGTFEQCSAPCDITEHWTVKYFHSVSGLCVVCEVHALSIETVLVNEFVHYHLWAEAESTFEHWAFNKHKGASWQQSIRWITCVDLKMEAV